VLLFLQRLGAPKPSVDLRDDVADTGKGVLSAPVVEISDEEVLVLMQRAGVTASVEDVRRVATKNLNFLVLQAATMCEHERQSVVSEEHVLRALPLFLR
jgi:hypothetical protein